MTEQRLVIGIDPGGKSTGIIAATATNRLNGLLAAVTVQANARGNQLPDGYYLQEVENTILEMIDVHGQDRDVLIGIEGISHPNPHMGLANIMALLATAAVYGHVLGVWPQTVVVEPGHNGSQSMLTYPEPLRAKPGGKGHDNLRHKRSAWDVAQKAILGTRVRAATLPARIGG